MENEKKLTAEEIVSLIKGRIMDEYRKHPDLDWQKIAATKIYEQWFEFIRLETLKEIKFTFEIHSDHSTLCNGYRSLCRQIEELS